MEKFEVTILGCGSALPTVKHNPSAQVVNLHENLYLTDCGEGTQLQLRKSHLNFSRIRQVFISHLHGDHCFGLPGLISTFSLLGRTTPLHLYGPKGLRDFLQPLLDFFCRNNGFEVVFHELDTKEYRLIYEDKAVCVYSIPLKHRVPCCGFLFQEKAPLPHIRCEMIDFLNIPHYAIKDIKEGADWETSEGKVYPNEHLVFPAEAARSYAYCSDTSYLPQNAERLRGVNLLYHEATFADCDIARAKETGHSTARQAAQMACDCEARQLLLGHFSARYEDENLLLEEARSLFPSSFLAREGLVVKVE